MNNNELNCRKTKRIRKKEREYNRISSLAKSLYTWKNFLQFVIFEFTFLLVFFDVLKDIIYGKNIGVSIVLSLILCGCVYALRKIYKDYKEEEKSIANDFE